MDCARNIITAAFPAGKTETTTAPLWQWDYGQALCITGIDLPAAFEVHFSTNRMGGVSTVAVGADGQVTIPNDLLTIGKNLNAWIYLSDAQGEGETEYSITIPVKPRPMPETYDAEVTGEFDDVVRQVGEYAETAQTAADNAGASATAAAASASEAAASASAAETAKTAAETAQGDAEDAQAAAETAAQTATEKAQQTAQDAAQAAQSKADAESAAGRAEAAETGAESAKTDAETAAQGAANSASAAGASATSAGQAATSAAQSATAAAGSATTAQGAAQTATTKAGEASASASAAAASETAAQTAQTGAEAAKDIAVANATTATEKAAEAAQSASGAAQSKTDAEAAATRAEQAAATLTVDDALSDVSENPVQNKVVTGAIADVKSAIDDVIVSESGAVNIFGIPIPSLAIGGINNKVYDASIKYRMATKEIISFDKPTLIRVPASVSSFSVYIHYYASDETHTTAYTVTGNGTLDTLYKSAVIPANQKFRVEIKRSPETSDAASYEEFTQYVKMYIVDAARFNFPVTVVSNKFYPTSGKAFDANPITINTFNIIEPTALVINRIRYDVEITTYVQDGCLAVALYDQHKQLLYSVAGSTARQKVTVKTSDHPTAYYFKVSCMNGAYAIGTLSVTVEKATSISAEVSDIEKTANDNKGIIDFITVSYDNVFNKNATSVSGYLVNGVVTGSTGTTFDYTPITKHGTYIANAIPKLIYGSNYNNSIAMYDSNKTYLRNATITLTVDDGNHSVGTFSVGSDVAYIRYTIGGSETDDTAMIIYGDTLPSVYVPYGTTINVTPEFQEAIKGNVLFGKVAVFDGDSICASYTDNSGKGAYAGRISVDNGLEIHNYAVGGGTITAETYSGSTPRHWVVDSIDTIYANYPNADYIILEGGTNDADIIGSIVGGSTPEKYGSYNLTDYSGNYNDETFCGAVEKLFFKAISYYPTKKIGFVIAMKMGKTNNGYTPDVNNRRAYFETIMILCKKWGIPYINLWDNCYMNPSLDVCYDSSMTSEENVAAGKMYKDGQHPAPNGYEYIASIIGAWMKTL